MKKKSALAFFGSKKEEVILSVVLFDFYGTCSGVFVSVFFI